MSDEQDIFSTTAADLDHAERELMRARIAKRLVTCPRTGCLVWVGASVHDPGHPDNRYGVLSRRGKRWAVRRLWWELSGLGELGDDTVGSTCGNSLCCSPDHMVRVERRKTPRRTDAEAS